MSNDISKFRVWDTKNKEYLDPDYYEEFALTADGEIHVGLTVWNGIGDEFQVIPPKQLIVERCIGLKDKNDELIYAGDIVRYNNDCTGQVCFKNGCFVWQWGLDDPPIYGLEKDKLEIIGNIHEYKRNENE